MYLNQEKLINFVIIFIRTYHLNKEEKHLKKFEVLLRLSDGLLSASQKIFFTAGMESTRGYEGKKNFFALWNQEENFLMRKRGEVRLPMWKKSRTFSIFRILMWPPMRNRHNVRREKLKLLYCINRIDDESTCNLRNCLNFYDFIIYRKYVVFFTYLNRIPTSRRL